MSPVYSDLTGYCLQVVSSPDLSAKLAPPPRNAPWQLDDVEVPTAPGRQPNLSFASHRKVKVPPIQGMADPLQRARILHSLANHELQAVELFAWVLLKFPTLPDKFIGGALAILRDEQKHLRLYMKRLKALGVSFGDYPVTGHFWNKLGHVENPNEFLCLMGLTFENANLDFASEYAQAAKDCGDLETEKVLITVHEDEIRHVRFAWRWLDEWTDGRPEQAYSELVKFPLGLWRARGKSFDRKAREKAGLSKEFVDAIAESPAKRPGGGSR